MVGLLLAGEWALETGQSAQRNHFFNWLWTTWEHYRFGEAYICVWDQKLFPFYILCFIILIGVFFFSCDGIDLASSHHLPSTLLWSWQTGRQAGIPKQERYLSSSIRHQAVQDRQICGREHESRSVILNASGK